MTCRARNITSGRKVVYTQNMVFYNSLISTREVKKMTKRDVNIYPYTKEIYRRNAGLDSITRIETTHFIDETLLKRRDDIYRFVNNELRKTTNEK